MMYFAAPWKSPVPEKISLLLANTHFISLRRALFISPPSLSISSWSRSPTFPTRPRHPRSWWDNTLLLYLKFECRRPHIGLFLNQINLHWNLRLWLAALKFIDAIYKFSLLKVFFQTSTKRLYFLEGIRISELFFKIKSPPKSGKDQSCLAVPVLHRFTFSGNRIS